MQWMCCLQSSYQGHGEQWGGGGGGEKGQEEQTGAKQEVCTEWQMVCLSLEQLFPLGRKRTSSLLEA